MTPTSPRSGGAGRDDALRGVRKVGAAPGEIAWEIPTAPGHQGGAPCPGAPDEATAAATMCTGSIPDRLGSTKMVSNRIYPSGAAVGDGSFLTRADPPSDRPRPSGRGSRCSMPTRRSIDRPTTGATAGCTPPLTGSVTGPSAAGARPAVACDRSIRPGLHVRQSVWRRRGARMSRRPAPDGGQGTPGVVAVIVEKGDDRPEP